MNVGKARFSPEAEFISVNFSKQVLVSKENLLEYCFIWELFTFGCRTKPGNLYSMNHNKTNYKMHSYSRHSLMQTATLLSTVRKDELLSFQATDTFKCPTK